MALATLDEFNFLPHRSEKERQWVVRASSGRYVKHFLKHDIVSVGHINDFKDIKDPLKLSITDIRKILNQPGKDGLLPHPSTISNHATQISDFIHEMKSGDLVITLDDRMVAIGRVADDAYIDDAPIDLVTESKKGIKTHNMPYLLRRKVNWGPKFLRSELPLTVEYTLRAHQTVFNIDKHWEYLYHLIYPVFRDEKNIYFSALIRQPNNIESYYVSQLLGYFSDLEAISKQLNIEKVSQEIIDDYHRLINIYNRNASHDLVCKAQFFSEGAVWWKQPIEWVNDYKRTITLLIGLEILFGGSIGFIELPGIITPEMRNNITNFILKTYETRDMDEVKKELRLTIPKYDTKPLDQPINQNTTTKTYET